MTKIRTTIAVLAATLTVGAAAPAVSEARRSIQAFPADPNATVFAEHRCERHAGILNDIANNDPSIYGSKGGKQRAFQGALDAASRDGCVVLF